MNSTITGGDSVNSTSAAESTRYTANDDDLPAICWPEGEAPPTVKNDSDRELARYAGVTLHYPALRDSELDRQRARAERLYQRTQRREARELRDEDRRIYIKKNKVAQMAAWIFALQSQRCVNRMDSYESKFFLSNFYKFKRWFGSKKGMRWVTLKQYEYTQTLALKYLAMPTGTSRDTLAIPTIAPYAASPVTSDAAGASVSCTEKITDESATTT